MMQFLVRLPILFLLLAVTSGYAQLTLNEKDFFARIKSGDQIPERLLQTRSVVFYPFTMSEKELETIQQSFQKIGIDAVAYMDRDLLYAGLDVSVAVAQYLNKREISNLVLFNRDETEYSIFIAPYNNRIDFIDSAQVVWTAKDKTLNALLQQVHRSIANRFVNTNFLINDYPEIEDNINPIYGRRSEFFAFDLKVDALAVPRFGDEAKDKELEEIMKTYPFKYALTDPALSETELRRMGYYYVLRFIHVRHQTARQVMGYSPAKTNAALVSVTYPGNEPMLKNIPADEPVYKFYFKHIDSGNVFLGTKWDADLTWQQALINHLKGFKAELGVD